MNTEQQAEDLLEQCTKSTSSEEEEKLLTEILGKDEASILEKIAKAPQCPTVFRCAAIDKYVGIKGGGSLELLNQLTNFTVEFDEEVRLTSYRWYSFFQSEYSGKGNNEKSEESEKNRIRVRGIIRTRGRSQALSGNWKQRAAGDPSPNVRWLASLGD